MKTRYSILAWRMPWTEEPSRLQSRGSQESDSTWRLNHHHSILAWETPWTEEAGKLQSMGSWKSWTCLSWLNNNKEGAYTMPGTVLNSCQMYLTFATLWFPILQIRKLRNEVTWSLSPIKETDPGSNPDMANYRAGTLNCSVFKLKSNTCRRMYKYHKNATLFLNLCIL